MAIDVTGTLPVMMRERASSDPAKFFIHEAGGRSATFKEMHELGLRWAGALQRHGIEAGASVASMLENCLDGPAMWIGLSWLKAVEVPISTLLKGSLLEHMLNLSEASLLVTETAYLPAIEASAGALRHLRTIVLIDGNVPAASHFEVLTRDAFLEGAVLTEHTDPPAIYDTASIMFTSGTTGLSKGAIVPWGYFLTSAEIQRMAGIGADDVIYHTGAANHAGTRAMVMAAAQVGASVVLKRSFKTGEFWSDIARYKCTYTALLGAMSHFIIRQPPTPEDANNSLRLVTMAPIHPEYQDFERRFGATVTSSYGSTEMPGVVTWAGTHITDSKSCGLRHPKFELRIVDEHDFEVPEGEVGELIVRGLEPWMLALGYLGMPDKTVEAWRNGWYHSGDGFRRGEEGRYYFVDRLKDTIRRRGENVSSFEVEAEVNSHPDVAECAAIGVPADELEEEIKIVLVATPGSRIDPAALIEYLMSRMPRFMVPRYVEIVEALPKTPTLRVKKSELRGKSGSEVWDRMAKDGVTR